MGSIDDFEPYPQPPGELANARMSGQRVHPLTPLAKGLLCIAAVTGIVINRILDADRRTDGDWIRDGVLVGGLFVVGLVVGYLSWRNTRYLLADDAVRVASGLVVRSDRTVTYARIQSVDVTEPFIARIMGLAGLRIDIAGGDEPVQLEFLRRADAERLREQLIDTALSHRPAPRVSGTGQPSASPASADDGSVSAGGTDRESWAPASPIQPGSGLPRTAASEAIWPPAESDTAEPAAERELFSHSPRRIIGAAVISSALLWSLAGLAYTITDLVIGGGELRLTTAVVLIGTFGPLWGFVVRHWNLTVTESERGLVVTRGLFSVTRESVLPGRVIGGRISEPVLWRTRGLAKLELDVAQGGLMQNPMVVVLAAGTHQELAAILARLGPQVQVTSAEWQGVSPRARFIRPIGWRLSGYAITPDLVAGRWGWFVRRTAFALHAQTVALTERGGPVQRRLDLLTLRVASPLDRNVVTIPHLDRAVAGDLAGELIALTYARRTTANGSADRGGSNHGPSFCDRPAESHADPAPPRSSRIRGAASARASDLIQGLQAWDRRPREMLVRLEVLAKGQRRPLLVATAEDIQKNLVRLVPAVGLTRHLIALRECEPYVSLASVPQALQNPQIPLGRRRA